MLRDSLPIFGFIVGAALRRWEAVLVTLAADLFGMVLVASLTDEIDGWSDPFVWGDTVIAVLATLLGVWVGKQVVARRVRPQP